jgi:NAD(P)-dependent dehydrogenase (short-subunit alcohol dehydrogenase family)
VNNAGFGLLAAVEEATAAQVESVFRTNVFGLLNVTRAVLPVMRRQRSGHVINMSSVGGLAGFHGWGVYGATKFAVEGLTEAMVQELKPLGIHVTAVQPGFFRTDFLDGQSLTSADAIADYADTVGQMRAYAERMNHKQPGDPAKLAKGILTLAALDAPPTRMPFGSDTLARMAAKASQMAAETAQWRDLSVSTDFTA